MFIVTIIITMVIIVIEVESIAIFIVLWLHDKLHA